MVNLENIIASEVNYSMTCGNAIKEIEGELAGVFLDAEADRPKVFPIARARAEGYQAGLYAALEIIFKYRERFGL